MMNIRAEKFERRRYTRFPVQEGVVAVPRSSLTKIGKVIDVSTGGLAVRCPSDGSWLNGSTEIDLLLLDDDYYLHKILVSVVHEAEHTNGNLTDDAYGKRCHLQFEKLTGKQKKDIEFFIKNFTVREN